MIWNTLLLALRAIRRNPLRAFLTVLGIVIGVFAVITMVTLGKGATRAISDQVSSLGSNLVTVRPGARLGPGGGAGAAPFRVDDASAIANQIAGLSAVAPQSSQNATVVAASQNWNSQIVGTTTEYFSAAAWKLAAGRTFNDSEERAGKAACVIGDTVRRELFGRTDPVGSELRVKRFSCEIVGVLAPKGQGAFGSDQDDIVVMPLRTLQRRLAGNQDVRAILVSVKDGVAMEAVKQELAALMRERRRIADGEEDDFNVVDTRQIAETLSATTKLLTSLLGAVAAVSLLVGGIGIMNIMLVSVTERTREIGIRLAIGALEHEVLLQFLIEAVVLACLGGLIGVLLATAATIGLAGLLGIPYLFDPGINLLSFAIAASVGVIFGYFPARRAARLDPIEALRHE
jgi:putative ABC transport system permease protein